MIKIGLKLWSTNLEFINNQQNNILFDYIELFVVPGCNVPIEIWKSQKTDYILHAPHSYSNLNLSLYSARKRNRLLIDCVEKLRNLLHPVKIIFHPGIEGTLNETIMQINFFQGLLPELFSMALIENKPKIGLGGEFCVGSSPNEIERIISETGIGFCLDVGHAIYYSAWADVSYKTVLDSFLKLEPFMFHLSDGITTSHTDIHLNFGKGDFDLNGIINMLPKDTYVTVEADHKSDPDIAGRDIKFLKTIINSAR